MESALAMAKAEFDREDAAGASDIRLVESMIPLLRARVEELKVKGGDTAAEQRNVEEFEVTLSLLQAAGCDSADEAAAKLAKSLTVAAAAPDNKRETLYDERIFRVNDFLFLGSEYGAQDARLLRALGITGVVNCVTAKWGRKGVKYIGCYFPEEFEYVRCDLVDSCAETVQAHQAAVAAANAALRKWLGEGRRVLVHCSAGMSRSPSIVMAWLMSSEGLSLRAAHDRVRAARGRDLDVRAVYYSSLYRIECPDASAAPTLDFAPTLLEDLKTFFPVNDPETVAAELAASNFDAAAVFSARTKAAGWV
jgi:hypothetical protein